MDRRQQPGHSKLDMPPMNSGAEKTGVLKGLHMRLDLSPTLIS